MSDAAPGVTTQQTSHGRIVTLAFGDGRAIVHEHGAHVTSWIPPRDARGANGAGDDVLFLSRLARVDGRSAIRGGVPVIFPQFGPGPLPKHGFARAARWTLDASGADGDGVPWARLALGDDAATRATWPHAFRATLTVHAGRTLRMALAVANEDGDGSDSSFAFTAALHTYFRVRDVERTAVTGLEGRRYRDQLLRTDALESAAPVHVAGPVDRVYAGVSGPMRIHDVAGGRTLRLATRGLPDAVLWNPWTEGARALDDLDDAEWREMLCLEAAAVATPVVVARGATWEGSQEIAVE